MLFSNITDDIKLLKESDNYMNHLT